MFFVWFLLKNLFAATPVYYYGESVSSFTNIKSSFSVKEDPSWSQLSTDVSPPRVSNRES